MIHPAAPQGEYPVRCLHWQSIRNEAAAAAEASVCDVDTADSTVSVVPC